MFYASYQLSFGACATSLTWRCSSLFWIRSPEYASARLLDTYPTRCTSTYHQPLLAASDPPASVHHPCTTSITASVHTKDKDSATAYIRSQAPGYCATVARFSFALPPRCALSFWTYGTSIPSLRLSSRDATWLRSLAECLWIDRHAYMPPLDTVAVFHSSSTLCRPCRFLHPVVFPQNLQIPIFLCNGTRQTRLVLI